MKNKYDKRIKNRLLLHNLKTIFYIYYDKVNYILPIPLFLFIVLYIIAASSGMLTYENGEKVSFVMHLNIALSSIAIFHIVRFIFWHTKRGQHYKALRRTKSQYRMKMALLHSEFAEQNKSILDERQFFSENNTNMSENDKIDKCIKIFLRENSVSTSVLCRNLGITYAEAARLMETMADKGLITYYQPNVPTTLLVTKEQWDAIKNGVKKFPAENYTSTDFDIMTGEQFEHFCAELLLKNGFNEATVTQLSGDFGIDILAEKDGVTYAIQCKCYSSNIGNGAVQEAYSGKEMYKRMVAVVMTNQYFTPAAQKTAEETRVLLWDRDVLLNMLTKANQ